MCSNFFTGTYSNLVKQAKSKQKILDKMEAAGLTPPVQHESTFHFQFPDTDKLPPPVLPFQGVSFSYSGEDKDTLYRVMPMHLSPMSFYRLPLFCHSGHQLIET